MPRYYIDLRGHFGTTEDPTGIELPDVAAAHMEALKVAERLLASWAGVPPKYRDEIIIEVVNEQLRPVVLIPFFEFATHRAQSWLGKSGQRAKWSFCLRAARMAAEQEKQ